MKLYDITLLIEGIPYYVTMDKHEVITVYHFADSEGVDKVIDLKKQMKRLTLQDLAEALCPCYYTQCAAVLNLLTTLD